MAPRCTPVIAALLLLLAGALAARQSPININERNVVFTSLPDLEFFNYNSILSEYVVENTGHSAQITLQNPIFAPSMVSGPLGHTEYKLQQIHFHWGRNSLTGSEHLLNGRPFSMEVHLVHYNSDYESFDEASTQPDGLAVIAFFINGGRRPRSYNLSFQQVVKHVARVVSPNDRVPATGDLLEWVTSRLQPNGFFTYDGSLTTEPYSENVIWIVYSRPIEIHRSQINAFRRLHGRDHELTENFREVQPLDGRGVEYVPEF